MTHRIEKPATLRTLGHQLELAAHRQAVSSKWPRGRRLRGALLIGGTAFLFAGGAGVATGLVPLPGDDGPAFVAQEATAEMRPALAARLSGLQRPREASDSLGEAAAFVTGPDRPAPGSSLRLTPPDPAPGTAHARPSTVDSWALPTDAGTVALEQMVAGTRGGPGSAVSADATMLDAGRAYMTTNDDLIGLAPDGVRNVDIHLANGSTVRLHVENNVFGAKFDQSVQGVTLGPADGGR